MIKTLIQKLFLMTQKNIKELKNIHVDQDIWVLAAGPSMNYLSPSFFENKITIGVNRICKFFNCDYIVAKDGRGFSEILDAIDNKVELILSKHESGNLYQNLNTCEKDHYIFDHPAKPQEKPDLSCIDKNQDKIVVSFSTITSAIHIAAYLGAKNIMICGHDCGTIDGESTIRKYYDKTIIPHQGTNEGYIKWLSGIEDHTILVASKIYKVFGCNIHSINPFLNFNLEGHKYKSSYGGEVLQRNLMKDNK